MIVTRTGSKLWRFAYRYDGKQKLLALGQYPIVSLLDARIKRDNAKRLLTEDIDPSVERKAERRDARMARANTFEAVAKELMDKFEGGVELCERLPLAVPLSAERCDAGLNLDQPFAVLNLCKRLRRSGSKAQL
ncbi:integrase arm-type DNA-binding domain-containing protein [Bradyrhizobium sp. HKCCYLS3077]|uniref:integrase arm-type DNA-binding domain-containing protein n=1 Tax=Bradyrhizobium sp. HKCCYLS3077 TaxID=3420761 RepID=UPI003EC03162